MVVGLFVVLRGKVGKEGWYKRVLGIGSFVVLSIVGWMVGFGGSRPVVIQVASPDGVLSPTSGWDAGL